MSTFSRRLKNIGRAIIIWYILNVAWNLYTLAHANPSKLFNWTAVQVALVLPWPISNPQTSAWVYILIVLLFIFFYLLTNKTTRRLFQEIITQSDSKPTGYGRQDEIQAQPVPVSEPTSYVSSPPVVHEPAVYADSPHLTRRRFFIGLGSLAGLGLVGFIGYEIHNSIFSPSTNGETLYQENGSDNWQGWDGGKGWRGTNGILTNDGSDPGNPTCGGGDPSIVAPITINTPNFAVETKMQVISLGTNFGITVGGSNGNWDIWNGYEVESSDSGSNVCLAHAPGLSNPVTFVPGTDWHTYRVEVTGQHGKFFVDDNLIIQSDHIDFFGGKVGIICGGTQINMSSFKVFAL